MLWIPDTPDTAAPGAELHTHADHRMTLSSLCLLQELGLSGVARIDGWVALDGPERLQLSEEVPPPAQHHAVCGNLWPALHSTAASL